MLKTYKCIIKKTTGEVVEFNFASNDMYFSIVHNDQEAENRLFQLIQYSDIIDSPTEFELLYEFITNNKEDLLSIEFLHITSEITTVIYKTNEIHKMRTTVQSTHLQAGDLSTNKAFVLRFVME